MWGLLQWFVRITLLCSNIPPLEWLACWPHSFEVFRFNLDSRLPVSSSLYLKKKKKVC